jgi:DNA helicase HerA-like ATPase
LEQLVETIRRYEGSRGVLASGVSVGAHHVVSLLNYQPKEGRGQYEPSVIVVIGEGERAIATFSRQVIDRTFEDRRTRSLLYPVLSFVFDEADVFISQETQGEGNVVEQATLLARRGRKFGLGLGIATQRIRYLNTSIMAQPHTYFISKLPRKSDREAVAEAFAISEESLEQSFGFSTGQWLIASHDATGLRGTPFPVQLPNANQAVRDWLHEYHANQGRGA